MSHFQKYFLVLLFAGFPFFAHADVSGSWIGWLYWSYDGTPLRCNAQMAFQANSEKFERVSGQTDCEYVAMQLDPKVWTLRDGILLEDGASVGTYEKDHYQWTENYSPTVIIQAELKVDGRHMDYSEKWIRKADQMEIYDIQGRLFLHEP
jgi:hypothetical protein